MKQEFRIDKVREYLLTILTNVTKKMNIDFLDAKSESYSISRLPAEPIVEKWIIPVTKKREIYNFVSRKAYSSCLDSNLSNIGFYEKFEKTISDNNNKKKLPDIKDIESISCLNCGSLQINETNTSVFSVQLEIIYREEL